MAVRFDDRLRTVLAQPAADPHDRAVRWRQLVELAARSQGEADPHLLEEAVSEIRNGAPGIDERVRSAAATAVAPLQLPFVLVAAFAADRLNVAAPILASARLTASEWKTVSSGASDECRSFIATLNSSSAEPPQPPPATPERHPATTGEASASTEAVPSISEVLARIERLRQLRESDPAPATQPSPEQPQADEPSRLFKWECNESGEIDWVDGAPRGALVGQSIAQRGIGSGVDPNVERAFAARAPFHQCMLELPTGLTIGGPWRISGIPAFERSSGRFAGYRGMAERASAAQPGPETFGSDSLRELAHEIRTPLNAIIGFAEIITGEYMGPAESHYHERAAEILSQARLLLSAVEDLDFAARLRSGDDLAEADLSDALTRSWEEIERQASARAVHVEIEAGEQPARCALDAQLTQRLVERLCLAVIGCAASGEKLTFRITSGAKSCSLGASLPENLRSIDLAPELNRRSDDSATLPLRLVMGLARTAGGELSVNGSEIVLRLPKA